MELITISSCGTSVLMTSPVPRSKTSLTRFILPLTRTHLLEISRKPQFYINSFFRAINPGGVRLGTPAMTTRGMKEADMEIIAGFLIKGIEISKRIQGVVGKQLKDFLPALDTDEEIKVVGEQVKAFAS